MTHWSPRANPPIAERVAPVPDRLTAEVQAVLDAAVQQERIGDEPYYDGGTHVARPAYLDACARTNTAIRAYRESQQKWRATSGDPQGCCGNMGSTHVSVAPAHARDRVLALLNAGEKALEGKP